MENTTVRMTVWLLLSEGYNCCQVQAHSAHHTTGQLIKRQGVEARNTTLFGKQPTEKMAH